MVITLYDIMGYSKYITVMCWLVLWMGNPTPSISRTLARTMVFTIGIYLAIRFR